MKKWQVALSGTSGRRAMAMAPRRFFSPLWASQKIGVRVCFSIFSAV